VDSTHHSDQGNIMHPGPTGRQQDPDKCWCEKIVALAR
jgi:hypothetical protein